jgi:hypothetical protein
MAKFISYKQVGDFVIKTELDPTSEELNTVCLVYYVLPNRDFYIGYELSKINTEAEVYVFSFQLKHQIKGKLEFRLRESPTGGVVDIYGELVHGSGFDDRKFEGLITQIDLEKGNLIEGTSDFPIIDYHYGSIKINPIWFS